LHHEETVLLLRPADRMRGSGPRTRLVGPMRRPRDGRFLGCRRLCT
jgi:hypothetical protein